MKTSELRQKTKEELNKNLIQEKEKLRNLRFGFELKKNKNVREMRKTKKNIAQILTILKEK
jgi:large subunit ribosomal protein L29